MAIVLDASYMLAIVLQEVAAPGLEVVTERIAIEGAVVPPLWRYEVANVLLVAARRKRIPQSSPQRILEELGQLPIRVDDHGLSRAWHSVFQLAQKHSLTVYDACYLELALRESAMLATLDLTLRAASLRDNVEVIGT